jgi:hypothetical protein
MVKKTHKQDPTLRQKETLKGMMENGGKVFPAAVKAGFTKGYAKSGKIQKTKSWQELLDEYIPDSKLVKKLNEGLNSIRVEEHKKVEDMPTRHRYLETAMKAKGKLTEKVDVTSEGEKIGGFVVVKTEKE